MNKNFQIFITGWGILLVAIVLNFLANYLGIETWYSFLGLVRESDFLKVVKDNWLSLIFLVLIYPFLLGLTAHYILKIFK
jgi:hypothetical protein